MAAHNDLGRWGEQKAAEFLAAKGYLILHQDWKTGRRDLDIVALTPDGSTLAVVEVKTRRGTDFATPEQSVDWRKMRSLTMAAGAYVNRYAIDLDIRFDIISVVGMSDDTASIDHIEGAFLPPVITR